MTAYKGPLTKKIKRFDLLLSLLSPANQVNKYIPGALLGHVGDIKIKFLRSFSIA
jgi:hypothetical protein